MSKPDFFVRLGKLIGEVVPHYGNKCANCGEDNPGFLIIDTIDCDITKRDVIGFSMKTYKEIKRDGFPKGKFQVLCANCSKGRYNNGGVFTKGTAK